MSSPIPRPDSDSSQHEPAKAAVETRNETHQPEVPVEIRDDQVTIAPAGLDDLEHEIARAAKQTRASPSEPVPSVREFFRISPAELEQLEREIAAEQTRIAHDLRRKLKPDILPPPPVAARRNDLAMVMRSAVVIALVSLAIPAALGAFPGLGVLRDMALEQFSSFRASAKQAAIAPPVARPAAPPRLVVQQEVPSPNGEAPLGIKIDGHGDGAVVILSDYPPGTAFSMGDAWGDTSWLIPAAELADARVRPPESFAGPMQFVAALRLLDGSLADRKGLRFDWPAPTAADVTKAGSVADVAKIAAPAPRRLDPEEIALLLQRGVELLETGDIASARLVLRRAAEAADAKAALALAGTYDPNVLRQLHVYGASPDGAKARAWYEKAIAFGSREAPRRLELLVSESR